VIKGAKNPNAAKLFLDFLLTKEAVDIVAEGEISFYSMLKDYEPPASVRKYMIDFNKLKVLAVKDQIEAAKKFKKMHEEWQQIFQ
jgi:ABC-type Fe3+ transport system substrate-binding protein